MVMRGQAIGAVGNTSRPGNNISRTCTTRYGYPTRSQSDIIRAVFNGSTFPYNVAA